MKVYLSTTEIRGIEDLVKGADILISYYYFRRAPSMMQYIPQMRNFMLDSGVFTFINSGKNVDIERYMCEYADFVRNNKIKQYVELDVDQIVGVRGARALRDRLESRVGWQSIPVWHTIRGKESFIQDCKDYNYIALGYFITEGLKNATTVKYAKAFCDLAHEHDCRIHGLGFTQTKILKNIPFDSVDSSSWLTGRRYGKLCRFDIGEKVMISFDLKAPQGKRIKNIVSLGRPNFIEWKKYQDYAYKNIQPIWE